MAGYLVTALIPARLDRWIIQRLAALLLSVRRQAVEHEAAQLAAALGWPPGNPDLLRVVRDRKRLAIENVWGRIRGTQRRGWQPEIRLVGLEQVGTALEQGRGVVLWRWSFCATPILKIALWRAQIPLVHLSRETHGAWSDGRIGLWLLPRLYRRGEDRYLAQRVLIPRSGSLGYMKTLLELLAENSVVSIVGDYTGRQNVTTSFLDGECQFAVGAPSLAWKSDATLLTAYAVAESCCSYRVVIDPPIQVDRGLDRKEFVRQAVAGCSRRLRGAIMACPADWGDWGPFLAGEEPFRRPTGKT
jgi:lauroyl/myristoyl acyltransferase